MKWRSIRLSELTQQEYAAAYEGLSPRRKARVDRLKMEADRHRTLAGEHLAKALVGKPGCIDADEKGKPYIVGESTHLSIAHSGELVVCAVDDAPIGIDVERIAPRSLTLAKRICVEEELIHIFGHIPTPEEYAATPTEEQLVRFYEVWTGKEGRFKQQGTGITDFSAVNILALHREIYRIGDYLVHIITS